MDFARWSRRTGVEACDAKPAEATGSCEALPPAHADIDSTIAGSGVPFDHGVCSLGGRPPKDGLWRGMHHHSQFKCVHVVNDGSPESAHKRQVSTFAKVPFPGSSALPLRSASSAFNLCELSKAACVPGSACEPKLQCSTVTAAVDQVGWQAVGYDGDYGGDTGKSYTRGCINEDVEWPAFVCPAFVDSNVLGSGLEFGQFSCYDWAFWTDGEGDENRRPLPLMFADEPNQGHNGSVPAPGGG
jgi:hypothetical protein